jgi:predicted nucleic acid-binding protein
MPAADVLLDSNVLVYALSDAPGELTKHERAVALIGTENFGVSYQVLMETWVVATRKFKRPLPPARVAAFMERILRFPCVAGTEGLYQQAVRLTARFGIHPYDAAIVAAAQELGANRVYSEDLSHGQIYEGVEVINPFLATA